MTGLGGYGMSSVHGAVSGSVNGNVNGAVNGNANGSEEVKTEKVPAFGGNGNQNTNRNGTENGNGIALPSSMPRIASVSRVHSQHGFDAFDANQQFLGSFDGAGTFLDADELNQNGRYQPTFDASNMLSRNQSDDFMFYSNIRSSLFAE